MLAAIVLLVIPLNVILPNDAVLGAVTLSAVAP
jgi:hypothetical protein